MVAVGENFSHYEIIAPIGAGGMGEVYLARDNHLERNVALKFVSSKPGQDLERAKRFIREAKAASALNHPNILTIYEVGETNGTRYIAAEYIDGISLRELIRRGGLTLNETLDIAMQALSAIATAHSAGIVHRDIKPENIMVRQDGVVKVLDFGLAKLIEPDAESSSSESVTKALITTGHGMVLGTAQYMSPEQARAKRVDARSDIWSLGVVLYEMLAGAPPFQGESVSDVFAAILKTEPEPISSHRPDLPPELEFIIKKALGKDPEDRYQTVKDFLVDLKLVKREFESGSMSAAYDPATSQTIRHTTNAETDEQRVTQAIVAAHRWKWIAVAGVVVAVLSGIGYLWMWSGATATGSPSAFTSSQVTSWKSELTDSGATSPRLSPDGKFVAYIASKDGKRTIWLKQFGGGDPFTRKQDAGTEETSPLWSPDGGQIAFLSERNGTWGIWMMPAFGGPQTLLAPIEARGQALVHWSRDGSKIFFDMKQNLYSLDLATKQITKLTNFDETVFIARGYRFSPDEKQIVFADRRDGRSRDIWVARPDGSDARRLVEDDANDSNPIWHPDGKRVIYNSERDGSQQIFIAHVDRRPPVQLVISDSDSRVDDISADGTKILYSTAKDDSDIWAVSVDGGKESQKTSAVGVEFWPDVSAIDDLIVFQSVRQPSIGNRILHSSIESIRPDGRQTVLAEDGFEPKFSPDGGRIAFLRATAGNNSLWITSAGGGDARQLSGGGAVFAGHTKLPFNRVQMQDYQWAKDGGSLVYAVSRDGLWNVWRVNLDGEETRLTNNETKTVIFFAPMLSADGNKVVWVARSSADLRQPRWSVWQGENGVEKQIFSSDTELGLIGWRHTENEVLVRIADTVSHAPPSGPIDVTLMAVPLDGSPPRQLHRVKSAHFHSFASDAKARTVAFVTRNGVREDLQVLSIAGGEPRTLASSSEPRVYFAGLAFAPDGKTIYYGKQANWQIMSMITNFK